MSNQEMSNPTLTPALHRIWEFPTIRGTLFWGPYNTDPTFSGTILGSPIFGNSHIEVPSWYAARNSQMSNNGRAHGFVPSLPSPTKDWLGRGGGSQKASTVKQCRKPHDHEVGKVQVLALHLILFNKAPIL